MASKYSIILFILCGMLLAACTPAKTVDPEAQVATIVSTEMTAIAATRTHTPAPSETPAVPPTETPVPTITPTPSMTPTATPDTRLLPKDWGSWLPVPEVISPHSQQIYLKGLQMGNNPRAFSVVGDCQSAANVFLGIYETDRYNLGRFDYLKATIDHFNGSYSRKSAAVKDGMSVASVLNPMWADPNQCEKNETPVDCELRVHKPAVMFINLGTNWKNGGPTAYEKYLRQIVQIVIDHGTVPILTTKADNIEGDHSLNLATAKVAYDFDIPLMNFWLASNDLPNHGLDGERDNVYLTPLAWDRRNFTALLMLDKVWGTLKQAYDPDSGLPVPTP